MEEKDKLVLDAEKATNRKSISIAVAERVEAKEEEELDKSKINVQKLRAELEKEKQFKKQAMCKEKAVVQTPNYDLIKEISPERRKKIYKIEKSQQIPYAKPFAFNKKLKAILFSLILLIGGAFCLSSGIDLIQASKSASYAQTQYELNLRELIKKISKIDSGNKALELIETYPDELLEPSSIAESTNWFDKICNFISGLFGG